MDAERMYQRQLQRAELAETWLNHLDLHPGAVALDVGCGPGLFSLMAARRVGPGGLVYAVDVSPEALAFLANLQEQQGLTIIERVGADARVMAPLPRPADAALITFMLHHDPDGAALLANVARMLKPGARAVVAEFDPDGPCQLGPAREKRIGSDTVRAWCQAAGLQVLEAIQQTPEHYILIVTAQESFTSAS